MRLLTIIFLLTFSSFTLFSQETGKVYSEKNMLASGYNSVLYKAKIHIYSRNISALYLFKNIDASSQNYNIVLLSEVGLTLVHLDYDRIADEFEVKFCSPIFQRKSILKAIQSDIKMLIVGVNNNEVTANTHSNQKIRSKGIKYFYESKTKTITRAKRRYSLLFSSEAKAKDYQTKVPSQINIQHKGVKFDISMTLIKED